MAIYFSYQQAMDVYQLLFIILGLFAPCFVALFMIYASRNKLLIKDFWDRLKFHHIKFTFFTLLLMLVPSVLFLATATSVFLGQPITQFTLANQFSNLQGQKIINLVLLFIAPFIAPIGEELGWRGYAMDSLRSQFNLFKTSILFGCIWALWHLPLFFVHNFYENRLWNMGFLYVVNFLLESIAETILINWVYYKNNRSILVAILLHFIFNFSTIIFQTQESTKCIMTPFFLVISAMVIIKNKPFFFNNT
jgi:membrane protease YdiL (CAAX protease family)